MSINDIETCRPTEGKSLTKLVNPSEHPELALLEQLWSEGLRATQIVEYLDKHGLPPVKVTALAKYGQRNWSGKVRLELKDNELGYIEEVLTELASKGMKASKSSFTKTEGWGWEKIDGVNTQVPRETVRQSIEIIPDIAVEYERATIPDVKIVSKPSKSRSKPSGWKLGISLPDMQIGFHRDSRGTLTTTQDEAAIDVAHQIILFLEEQHGVDLIVNQGDNLDFPEFSTHRSAPGYLQNTQLTIDRGGLEAKIQRELAPNSTNVWLEGNHECLSEDTLAMTYNGLKSYDELAEGELVLSCDDNQEPIWLPIKQILSYDYSGDMYSSGGRLNMLVTPGHRIVGYEPNKYSKGTIAWKESYAEEMTGTIIPTSVVNTSKDDPSITDDEIRLIAWCLTDSYVSSTGKWCFYQAKSKAQRILGLLDRLDINYGFTERDRDITEICGKELLKAPQTSLDIRVSAESSPKINAIIDNKTKLPLVLADLSRRQFDIFYKEMLYTDGTMPTGGTKSGVIYHSRETRFELQELFTFNGYSCTLTEYAPTHWRLNISDIPATRLDASTMKKVEYTGKVWCLVVENERFFASRDNHPFLTGNCRITNVLTDKLPNLVGLARSGEDKPVNSVSYLCRFEEYGMEYLEGYPDAEFWANDGLRFVHGHLYSSTKGGTANKYLAKGISTIHGHTHRAEMLWGNRKTKDGGHTVFAGSAGCLCRTDGAVPSTSTGITGAGKQNSKKKTEDWQQGIFVVWYEVDGLESRIEHVMIEDGKAIFRGIEFNATVDPNGEKL